MKFFFFGPIPFFFEVINLFALQAIEFNQLLSLFFKPLDFSLKLIDILLELSFLSVRLVENIYFSNFANHRN